MFVLYCRRAAGRLNSGVRHVKDSIAIVGAPILVLATFIATLSLARREYARELLVNTEATAAWKESDSISRVTITSHIIKQLNGSDEASATQTLCNSLQKDLQIHVDLAEYLPLNDRRMSALSNGRATYKQLCSGPHA